MIQDIFDLEAFRSAPLVRQPYDYLILPAFVKPEALRRLNSDYPHIEQTGSFPLDALTFGPGFRDLIEALECAAFRRAFEEKFGVDLSHRPTTITARGRCGGRDGSIHCDSRGKVITVLLYVNPEWADSGGRLRILRSRTDINDVAAEVPPSGGTLVAFLRSDHSWHGHLPFHGERRVIQFNWVHDTSNQRLAIFRHRLSASMKHLFGALRPTRESRPPGAARM